MEFKTESLNATFYRKVFIKIKASSSKLLKLHISHRLQCKIQYRLSPLNLIQLKKSLGQTFLFLNICKGTKFHSNITIHCRDMKYGIYGPDTLRIELNQGQ